MPKQQKETPMSKLQSLLESKAKLTIEVQALEAVLLDANESQSLTISSSVTAISFEEKDDAAGNKVLAVLEEEFFRLGEELQEVNKKVSALEALL